jgi:hypothetical protein
MWLMSSLAVVSPGGGRCIFDHATQNGVAAQVIEFSLWLGTASFALVDEGNVQHMICLVRRFQLQPALVLFDESTQGID